MLLRPAWRGLRNYEAAVWPLLLDEVQSGDVLLDVGANCGIYAVAAAQRGARVLAFEPDPVNARILRHHVRLNRVAGRVRVVEAYLGEQALPVVAAERGSPVTGVHDLYLSDATRYTVRPSLPADAVLKDEPRIDLVKIDVEGAELDVLRGARRLFERTRPRRILIEVHPDVLALLGHSVTDLDRELDGYDLERISDADADWLLAARHPSRA